MVSTRPTTGRPRDSPCCGGSVSVDGGHTSVDGGAMKTDVIADHVVVNVDIRTLSGDRSTRLSRPGCRRPDDAIDGFDLSAFDDDSSHRSRFRSRRTARSRAVDAPAGPVRPERHPRRPGPRRSAPRDDACAGAADRRRDHRGDGPVGRRSARCPPQGLHTGRPRGRRWCAAVDPRWRDGAARRRRRRLPERNAGGRTRLCGRVGRLSTGARNSRPRARRRLFRGAHVARRARR